jgi:excisionase family DNA binding protein
MLKEKRWYTCRDVADILEVSPQRISQMAKVGLLPHYRIGRTIKIDREEFSAWLDSNRRGPT